MGYVTLINPVRKMQMDIPYMGLHFMENGSFSFGTDENYQRINIDSLKKIIYPYDPKHILPVAGDTDNDGLKDVEEDSLWMDYMAETADFNNDGLPDGVGIAQELIHLFPKLKEQPDGMHSSIKFIPVWGLETCRICGSTHNMGYIEIINPENKRTCQIPFLSLHAMAHGSFTCDGTIHDTKRVNVIELLRTMKTHRIPVNDDTDNDGLKDAEEEYFGFNPNTADSKDDGVSDGMELALAFADTIKSLPREPRSDGPYMEYLGMYGIHPCAICGNEIPMGEIKIYNPLISSSPIEFSNYAFHFLERGSFACEGADEHRIDPIVLSLYLGFPTAGTDIDKGTSYPVSFQLEQNYPNPFNPTTTIKFQIPKSTFTTLKVYNILVKEVATLVSAKLQKGNHVCIFDGKNLASGVYYYQLVSGEYREVKKLLLVK
jgi:hypothetical protein